MQLHFYTNHRWGFEEWNYLSPETPGIGGSETAQVEMSWRLARRGHEVTCYAPLPEGTAPVWRHTTWLHSREADFSQPGLWILSRCPEVLDQFPDSAHQRRWLVCQDVTYPELTEARAEKLEYIFGLCPTHVAYLRNRFPFAQDKIALSANGIRSDFIRTLWKQQSNFERNPYTLLWSSSPDRGLETLLRILQRAKQFIPDLDLHCYYGWDNIDKIIAEAPQSPWASVKRTVEHLLPQVGAHWHGRIGQMTLLRALMQTSLWVYPTEFTETSCISSMEAQACGAIPITNPLWGLDHNVRHGILIEGDPWQDSLTRARYVGELVRWAAHPENQVEFRPRMVHDALVLHNWENVANQYEFLMLGHTDRNYGSQYAYQIKNSTGRVLNIGCNTDVPGFGKIEGNVNVDIHDIDPHTKVRNAVHRHADARDLPMDLWGQFDTALLGDILEHMHDTDIVVSLGNAKRATKTGRVVVTFPEDDRPEFLYTERHSHQDYLPGVRVQHYRTLTQSHFEELVREAGMRVQHHELIDYGFAGGHGMILRG